MPPESPGGEILLFGGGRFFVCLFVCFGLVLICGNMFKSVIKG